MVTSIVVFPPVACSILAVAREVRLGQRSDTLAEMRRQHLIAIYRSRPVIRANVGDVEAELGQVTIKLVDADSAAADWRIQHLVVGDQKRDAILFGGGVAA